MNNLQKIWIIYLGILPTFSKAIYTQFFPLARVRGGMTPGLEYGWGFQMWFLIHNIFTIFSVNDFLRLPVDRSAIQDEVIQNFQLGYMYVDCGWAPKKSLSPRYKYH